jgi:hypothetical protein
MSIYLSGPMRADTREQEDANFAAFAEAAARLMGEGCEVVNPAENFGGKRDLDVCEYFLKDTRDITECDALVLLPGWWDSRGSLYEIDVALTVGLPVLLADTRHDIRHPGFHNCILHRRLYLELDNVAWQRARVEEVADVRIRERPSR